MALTLAFLEAMSLMVAVFGAIMVWGHPVIASWADLAVVMGQAALASVGCLVAFYFNDLYDFRVVRTLAQFTPRMVQSIGIAFVIIAVLDVAVFAEHLPAHSFV